MAAAVEDILDVLVQRHQDFEGASASCLEFADSVEDLILIGDINSALETIQASSTRAAVLQDSHLLFQLQKQRVIDHIASDGALDESMRLHRELGTAALSAYPEAYEEFKAVGLALVFPKGTNVVVDSLLSAERRQGLGGLVWSSICQLEQPRDTQLSLLLRACHAIHSQLLDQQLIAGARQPPPPPLPPPAAELLQRLVPGRVRPAAAPPSSHAAAQFPEIDVQSIVQGCGQSRQAAVDAMRRARGDRDCAYCSELQRIAHNQSLLAQLAAEYAAFRGLRCAGAPSSSGTRQTAAAAGRAQAAEEAAAEAEAFRELQALREALLRGPAAEALRLLDALCARRAVAPDPRLLFRVRLVRFAELLSEAGAEEAALAFVRERLSGLAESCPDLVPDLKAALVALAVGSIDISREAVANEVHTALWGILELPQPRLVPLMSALLARHAAFFRRQRCEDPFAGVLGLRAGRLWDGFGGQDDADEAEEDLMGDEEMDEDEEDEEAPRAAPQPLTDRSILTLQEFLSTTREDAIYLLTEHHGDVEAALASVLG